MTICESSWPWLLLYLCFCRVTFRQALHDRSPSWSRSDVLLDGREYIDTYLLRKVYRQTISLFDYVNTGFFWCIQCFGTTYRDGNIPVPQINSQTNQLQISLANEYNFTPGIYDQMNMVQPILLEALTWFKWFSVRPQSLAWFLLPPPVFKWPPGGFSNCKDGIVKNTFTCHYYLALEHPQI